MYSVQRSNIYLLKKLILPFKIDNTVDFAGASSVEAHQDGQVLQSLLCEEGLRELDLVILKKDPLGET